MTASRPVFADTPDAIDWEIEANNNSLAWKERIYQEATRLARLGFRVFPLRRLGKASISTSLCHHMASSSQSTVLKWFSPIDGLYAGHNLGIATGGNCKVMVIDLDCKKDEKQGILIDGISELRTLEQANDDRFPRTMVSSTPSGGQHLFVKWDLRIPHGQNVLARGIDVRSGGENSSSGHVVVFPSVVGGKSYCWKAGPIYTNDLGPVPEWACRSRVDATSDKPEWISSDNLGNEKVAESDLLQNISMKDAINMLDAIPPQELDYDEWVKVGRAIFSQWPDNTGLKMWDEWSSRDSSRYRNRDCSSRWIGFKNGRIGIGTLVWMAKKHGWKPGPGHDVLIALERINTETPGIIAKGKERWVLMDNQDGASLMGRNAAMLYHAIHKVDIGNDDKPKLVNPLTLWDSWKDRCLYKRMALFPHPVEEDPEAYNLWKGFAHQPVPGDVSIWLDFVREIIIDDHDRDWIHDWIAFMFQKPGIKPTTSLVLRGSEGIGKNTFTDTIGMLFHPANWTQFEDTDQALSQFNSQMLYNVWLVMNEAIWSGNHKHASKLKGIITEPRLSIEMKGIDKFMAPNYSHVVIMTNEDWAVPAGLQSRRFMVVDVPDVLRHRQDFWKDFRTWRSKPESKQALLHWYLTRKITHNLHQVPENKALHRQRTLTEAREDKGIPIEVISDLLNNGKAARHTGGGQWAGYWFWPNSLIKESWRSFSGRNCPANAPSKIRSMINHLLSSDLAQLHVWIYGNNDQKNRSIYGVALPDNPEALVNAMIESGLIKPGDIDVSQDWEELPKQNW